MNAMPLSQRAPINNIMIHCERVSDSEPPPFKTVRQEEMLGKDAQDGGSLLKLVLEKVNRPLAGLLVLLRHLWWQVDLREFVSGIVVVVP